jgi:tetratricopeptide (TPR) repeat protein
MSAHAKPRTKRPIFLSSVIYENGAKLKFRRRIIELTGGKVASAERPVWLSEDFREQLHEDYTTLTPLEMAEFCVEGVRLADCFVAVLTERWGSEIAVDPVGLVPTSFFEIELVFAALFQKPAFIFLLKGFKPSPALDRLITLLRPALHGLVIEELDEDEILRRIDRLVRQLHWPSLRPLRPYKPNKRLLIDRLYASRHRPYCVDREPPPIRFLDGGLDSGVDARCAAMVEPLLESAKKESNYQRKLLNLWFAYRALMSVPYKDPAYASYATLWTEFLTQWSSAAAWYGLHAHAAMGSLAALGSLTEIRLSMSPHDPRAAIPHGPLASSYYSIAQHAGRSAEIFSLALQHLDVGIAIDAKATNLVAIRGSVQLQLKNTEAAIDDYSAVARARQHLADGTYGEALSELGHALVIAGRRKEGLAAMERGVELLKNDPRPGFDIRALRKLAIGYAKSLDFSGAVDSAIAAHDKAMAIGAFDQVRGLERLAKTLDWLRRGKPSSA